MTQDDSQWGEYFETQQRTNRFRLLELWQHAVTWVLNPKDHILFGIAGIIPQSF